MTLRTEKPCSKPWIKVGKAPVFFLCYLDALFAQQNATMGQEFNTAMLQQ
jgi:hypothetical protein